MPMTAGRLRDRVTILTRTETRSALGVAEVWSESDTIWARVAIVSAISRAAFQQTNNSVITHDILFRHSETLDLAGKRFRWRGADFEIIEPAHDIDGTGAFMRVRVRKLP